MDIISLKNARFTCSLGINDDEKTAPQEIEVDIDLLGDTKNPGITDRIEDALNYAEVHDSVRETVAARHYNLIESLAENIAGRILERHAVSGVTVRIRKPKALASQGVQYASIEITRYGNTGTL